MKVQDMRIKNKKLGDLVSLAEGAGYEQKYRLPASDRTWMMYVTQKDGIREAW